MSKKTSLCRLLLILWTVFIFPLTYFTANGYDSNTKNALKNLARMATCLAQNELSEKADSKKGLLLVKFAHHIYPKYRPLLLLRAKLKYKLPISPSEKEVSEKEFVKDLKELIELLPRRKSVSKHLNVLAHAMILQIKPNDEDSLVNIMAFEDAGMSVDLEELLMKNLDDFKNIEYDPSDPRYIISNVKKTILVPAKIPWTDTWVNVKAGKIIRAEASRLWGFGEGPFPSVGPGGFSNIDRNNKSSSRGAHSKIITKRKKSIPRKRLSSSTKLKKTGIQYNPGCLLAKIGNKIYYVGEEAVFKAETSGILYFGPFEWSDYSDNFGELQVTFEVSDK